MTLNIQKFVLALVGLLGVFTLMAIGTITSAVGMPIVTLIVGYAVGNGIGAKQGTPIEPIIGRKPQKD